MILQKVRSLLASESDLSSEASRSRQRYRRAALTSVAALVARIVSFSVSFVTVPLTLKYLGTERFGVWMIVSSTIGMLSFADLGMSNGLINLVAEASGKGDRKSICGFVASAFWMLSLIGVILTLTVAGLYSVIPWADVFNLHSAQAVAECGPVFLVVTIAFALNMPLATVGSLQSGQQSGLTTNLWNALGSIISVVAVLWAIHFHAGLALLVLALSCGPVLSNLANAGKTFLRDQPWLVPRLSLFSREAAGVLLRTGSMFFCLQVATAIGYQSDNLVIAHIQGATKVASYAVPSRLFNALPFLVGIVTGPMWPAYAEALSRGDGWWIRKTFRRTVLWVGGATFLLTAILVAFGKFILAAWVGPGLQVSFVLLAAFGVRCVLSAYLQPLSYLLNGIGKLKEQAVLALLMAVVNLGLSILFVRLFGVLGAILGTVVSEIIVIVIPETIIADRALKRLGRLDPVTVER